MSKISDDTPQLESSDINNENNEQSLLNKIFRRRSSQNSRKSIDESQHKDSFMQYLTTHKNHSRNNSSNNPCYRLSFQVGVLENKNTKYRPTMEDVHTYVANFAERLDWGYFAIFDGHAGKQTARWCGSNLHSIVENNILKNDNLDLRSHLNNSFIESDERIRDECTGSSGSTAAVAVLRWEEVDTKGKKNHHHHRSSVDPYSTPFDFVPTLQHKRMLYTANVGDSRLVLSRGGQLLRLSYDHKGSDLNEQERIINSGGVVMKSRVNGMLAVTRSLGDTYMKDLVIGNPYTTATEITDQDEFLIIACDGLWDVCSDQRAIDLIKDVKDLNKLAKILCNYAMDNMTTDNITVMVVKFDNGVFKFKNDEGEGTGEDNLAVVDDEVTISNSTRPSDDDDDNNEEDKKNEIEPETNTDTNTEKKDIILETKANITKAVENLTVDETK